MRELIRKKHPELIDELITSGVEAMTREAEGADSQVAGPHGKDRTAGGFKRSHNCDSFHRALQPALEPAPRNRTPRKTRIAAKCGDPRRVSCSQVPRRPRISLWRD